MKAAIDETNRRRKKQQDFNQQHGITPKQIVKKVEDLIDGVYHDDKAKIKVKVNKKDTLCAIANSPQEKNITLSSILARCLYAKLPPN